MQILLSSSLTLDKLSIPLSFTCLFCTMALVIHLTTRITADVCEDTKSHIVSAAQVSAAIIIVETDNQIVISNWIHLNMEAGAQSWLSRYEISREDKLLQRKHFPHPFLTLPREKDHMGPTLTSSMLRFCSESQQGPTWMFCGNQRCLSSSVPPSEVEL